MEYISEKISKNDIATWKEGDKILITAPTGSGKTTFVQTVLYDYCKENNKKVLYLVNREILGKQLKENNDTKDIITIETYQKITSSLCRNHDYEMEQYDYIVSDECHYFFSDSLFNDTTDILLNKLTKMPTKSINIFMSATVDLFKSYIEQYCNGATIKIYKIRDLKPIRALLYFNKRETIDDILARIPNDEKAIIFFSSAQRALEYAEKYPTLSEVLCSSSSPHYEDTMELTKEKIINNSKFDAKFLFTTSVLDNGINIKDKAVKHIITDMFDKDTIIQCIGRKRFEDDDDYIYIYCKTYGRRELLFELNRFNKKYEVAKEFKDMEIKDFITKYGRSNFNGIIYLTTEKNADEEYIDEYNTPIYLKCNDALYHKIYNNKQYIGKLVRLKMDHTVELYKTLGLNKTRYVFYDALSDRHIIKNLLRPYLNRKLFEDDRFALKTECMNNIKTAKKRNGVITSNEFKIWLEKNTNYKLIKKSETTRKNKNLIYWIIS